MPESRLTAARRRYDPFGAVSITSALVVLVYAISEAPQVGLGATRTMAMLAVGGGSARAFLIVETRVEAPLLPLRLFRLSTVAGSNAVGFLLSASFYTFIFVGTLYMQQVLGYSALKTGLAWLTASVTCVAFAGPSQNAGHQDLAQAGHGLRHGPHRSRHPVGHPDSGGRELLAGPGRTVLRGGIGVAFAFIPVSIGALTGVTESDAGVASGLSAPRSSSAAPSEWLSPRPSPPLASTRSSITATQPRPPSRAGSTRPCGSAA